MSIESPLGQILSTDRLPIINGQEPSKEEEYFLWWCRELYERDLIIDCHYKKQTFHLADPVKTTWVQSLKTKYKDNEKTLLPGASYSPDFYILFKTSAYGLLYFDTGRVWRSNPFNKLKFFSKYCFIDIKGGFNKYGHEQGRAFELSRKWVADKHGIFVFKITIPKLFEETFVPERYLFTDKKKSARTINFRAVTLNEYLKTMQQWKEENLV